MGFGHARGGANIPWTAPHHKVFSSDHEIFSGDRDSCDPDTCLQHPPRPHSNPSPPADAYPLNPSPRLFAQSTDTVPSESESQALRTINRYCSLRIRVPLHTMPGPIEEGQELVDFAAFKVALQDWAVGYL